MDDINVIEVLHDISQSVCQLRHPFIACIKDHPAAVDAIIVPMSDGNELSIPVCAECAETISGHEWTLLFCIMCLESRWVCHSLSKLEYPHHIVWLKGCPECTGKFGGVYF